MTAITIADLTNAKSDVDHIAEISTSTNATATDRLGHVKSTMQGAVDSIKSFNSRGAWAATTAYAVKDLVSNSGTWYVCVVAHTSSAAFATDTASKWRVYQGVIAGDLAASSGASGVGYAPGGVSAIAATVAAMFNRMMVNVFNFMTEAQIADVQAGTLAQDVTAAVQAAITYAAPLGRILYCPAGGYKLTATLIKAAALYGLQMMGDGYRSTRFSYTGLASGSPCLRVIGGSGTLCGAKIEGIGFDGNVSTWGIELQGQCGQDIRRCQFGVNARGVVFHNASSGSFTEYCTATDCDFSSTCVTAIEYKRTSGNDSFNGSGLAGNCTVNSNSTNPVVIVGNGCFPYNAPLSLQLWNAAAMTLIQNLNTTALNCNWYGCIRMEQNTRMVTLATDDATGRSFFVGQVIGLSEYWQRGDLYLCSQFNGNNSGIASLTLQPFTVKQIGLVTGANTVPVNILSSLGDVTNLSCSLLLHINIIGTNYHYSHLAVLTLAQGKGGSDAVTVLATQQAFNAAGWGACTFSVNGSGQLVITNGTVGFSAGVYVGVSQIGGGMGT